MAAQQHGQAGQPYDDLLRSGAGSADSKNGPNNAQLEVYPGPNTARSKGNDSDDSRLLAQDRKKSVRELSPEQKIKQADTELADKWNSVRKDKGANPDSINEYMQALNKCVDARLEKLNKEDPELQEFAKGKASEVFKKEGLAQKLLILESTDPSVLPREITRAMAICKSTGQIPDQAAAEKAFVLDLRSQARGKLTADESKARQQSVYDSLKGYFLDPKTHQLAKPTAEQTKELVNQLHTNEAGLNALRISFMTAYSDPNITKDTSQVATRTTTEKTEGDQSKVKTADQSKKKDGEPKKDDKDGAIAASSSVSDYLPTANNVNLALAGYGGLSVTARSASRLAQRLFAAGERAYGSNPDHPILRSFFEHARAPFYAVTRSINYATQFPVGTATDVAYGPALRGLTSKPGEAVTRTAARLTGLPASDHRSLQEARQRGPEAEVSRLLITALDDCHKSARRNNKEMTGRDFQRAVENRFEDSFRAEMTHSARDLTSRVRKAINPNDNSADILKTCKMELAQSVLDNLEAGKCKLADGKIVSSYEDFQKYVAERNERIDLSGTNLEEDVLLGLSLDAAEERKVGREFTDFVDRKVGISYPNHYDLDSLEAWNLGTNGELVARDSSEHSTESGNSRSEHAGPDLVIHADGTSSDAAGSSTIGSAGTDGTPSSASETSPGATGKRSSSWAVNELQQESSRGSESSPESVYDATRAYYQAWKENGREAQAIETLTGMIKHYRGKNEGAYQLYAQVARDVFGIESEFDRQSTQHSSPADSAVRPDRIELAPLSDSEMSVSPSAQDSRHPNNRSPLESDTQLVSDRDAQPVPDYLLDTGIRRSPVTENDASASTDRGNQGRSTQSRSAADSDVTLTPDRSHSGTQHRSPVDSDVILFSERSRQSSPADSWPIPSQPQDLSRIDPRSTSDAVVGRSSLISGSDSGVTLSPFPNQPLVSGSDSVMIGTTEGHVSPDETVVVPGFGSTDSFGNQSSSASDIWFERQAVNPITGEPISHDGGAYERASVTGDWKGEPDASSYDAPAVRQYPPNAGDDLLDLIVDDDRDSAFAQAIEIPKIRLAKEAIGIAQEHGPELAAMALIDLAVQKAANKCRGDQSVSNFRDQFATAIGQVHTALSKESSFHMDAINEAFSHEIDRFTSSFQGDASGEIPAWSINRRTGEQELKVASADGDITLSEHLQRAGYSISAEDNAVSRTRIAQNESSSHETGQLESSGDHTRVLAGDDAQSRSSVFELTQVPADQHATTTGNETVSRPSAAADHATQSGGSGIVEHDALAFLYQPIDTASISPPDHGTLTVDHTSDVQSAPAVAQTTVDHDAQGAPAIIEPPVNPAASDETSGATAVIEPPANPELSSESIGTTAVIDPPANPIALDEATGTTIERIAAFLADDSGAPAVIEPPADLADPEIERIAAFLADDSGAPAVIQPPAADHDSQVVDLSLETAGTPVVIEPPAADHDTQVVDLSLETAGTPVVIEPPILKEDPSANRTRVTPEDSRTTTTRKLRTGAENAESGPYRDFLEKVTGLENPDHAVALAGKELMERITDRWKEEKLDPNKPKDTDRVHDILREEYNGLSDFIAKEARLNEGGRMPREFANALQRSLNRAVGPEIVRQRIATLQVREQASSETSRESTQRQRTGREAGEDTRQEPRRQTAEEIWQQQETRQELLERTAIRCREAGINATEPKHSNQVLKFMRDENLNMRASLRSKAESGEMSAELIVAAEDSLSNTMREANSRGAARNVTPIKIFKAVRADAMLDPTWTPSKQYTDPSTELASAESGATTEPPHESASADSGATIAPPRESASAETGSTIAPPSEPVSLAGGSDTSASGQRADAIRPYESHDGTQPHDGNQPHDGIRHADGSAVQDHSRDVVDDAGTMPGDDHVESDKAFPPVPDDYKDFFEALREQIKVDRDAAIAMVLDEPFRRTAELCQVTGDVRMDQMESLAEVIPLWNADTLTLWDAMSNQMGSADIPGDFGAECLQALTDQSERINAKVEQKLTGRKKYTPRDLYREEKLVHLLDVKNDTGVTNVAQVSYKEEVGTAATVGKATVDAVSGATATASTPDVAADSSSATASDATSKSGSAADGSSSDQEPGTQKSGGKRSRAKAATAPAPDVAADSSSATASDATSKSGSAADGSSSDQEPGTQKSGGKRSRAKAATAPAPDAAADSSSATAPDATSKSGSTADGSSSDQEPGTQKSGGKRSRAKASTAPAPDAAADSSSATASDATSKSGSTADGSSSDQEPGTQKSGGKRSRAKAATAPAPDAAADSSSATASDATSKSGSTADGSSSDQEPGTQKSGGKRSRAKAATAPAPDAAADSSSATASDATSKSGSTADGSSSDQEPGTQKSGGKRSRAKASTAPAPDAAADSSSATASDATSKSGSAADGSSSDQEPGTQKSGSKRSRAKAATAPAPDVAADPAHTVNDTTSGASAGTDSGDTAATSNTGGAGADAQLLLASADSVDRVESQTASSGPSDSILASAAMPEGIDERENAREAFDPSGRANAISADSPIQIADNGQIVLRTGGQDHNITDITKLYEEGVKALRKDLKKDKDNEELKAKVEAAEKTLADLKLRDPSNPEYIRAVSELRSSEHTATVIERMREQSETLHATEHGKAGHGSGARGRGAIASNLLQGLMRSKPFTEVLKVWVGAR